MILSVQTPPARPHMVHHLCEGKGLKMNTSPDATISSLLKKDFTVSSNKIILTHGFSMLLTSRFRLIIDLYISYLHHE